MRQLHDAHLKGTQELCKTRQAKIRYQILIITINNDDDDVDEDGEEEEEEEGEAC